MENRALALQNVAEAINLDSSGFHQAAFAKYLQSLQILTSYLNGLFATYGFQKLLEKKREVAQVLSMIHECSDRVSVIVDEEGKSKYLVKPTAPPPEAVTPLKENNQINSVHVNSKFPAFEKMQNENMMLLKKYQQRIEKASDKYSKENLRLELQRRLSENFAMAQSKYSLAVKELQKERVQLMEKTLRQLLEKGNCLNEKERERRELYACILDYAARETWPCSWKLNAYDMTPNKAVEKVFSKVIRCTEHPLSQWLILIQTNIKREVETLEKEYYEFRLLFPDFTSDECLKINSVEVTSNSISIMYEASKQVIPLIKILSLQRKVKSISVEISSVIGDVLQMFYMTYKSLLPDESETLCYKLIEQYMLKSMWPSLIILFRISNLPSEYRISETMCQNRSSPPSAFGFPSEKLKNEQACSDVVKLLKTVTTFASLVEKLKVLVEVSQKLCECDILEEDGEKKPMGADEFIPLLCYIVTQTGLPQLISECTALEELIDMKYMLGEEGYALSSFLTALKYIEMKKIIDGDGKAATNPV